MKSASAEAVRWDLREREAFGRCSDLDDEQLDRVIAHVGGNVGLAADALAQRPWPAWLMGVLFPNRRSVP